MSAGRDNFIFTERAPCESVAREIISRLLAQRTEFALIWEGREAVISYPDKTRHLQTGAAP
jgi:hypothetical protein